MRELVLFSAVINCIVVRRLVGSVLAIPVDLSMSLGV